MTTINQLSTLGSLATSDKLIVYSSDNGDARKTSLATLLAFIESQFASPEYTTVITAPTSSGFNIQMPTYTTNVWEIINPTGTFAAGTLTLPAPANCFDGQQIIVCTTQIITAFTLNGNGSTTVGVPTSLGAGGFFTIRFNALQSVWYCVSQNIVSTFTALTLSGGINDSNGNELLKVVATAAAVNELTLANAATGGAPSLTASGGDADISINLVPKGAGVLKSSNVPVVTTTGAQTLTNKTLTAPVVNNATMTQPVADMVITTAVTVASLPNPVTTPIGARMAVTNANATLTAGIGAIVAGGGANAVPVFNDGANWRIG